MNLIFLRGKADRPKEIAFKSIMHCSDMWEELAFAMCNADDTFRVLYWGGHRKAYYDDNFSVVWVHDFEQYRGGLRPDVIIARGGFPEYVPFLKDFPGAMKVYYGANHGPAPKDGIKYDLVLCDSDAQIEKARKHGFQGELYIKAASHIFRPLDVAKKYDVCFSAITPTDKRKRVKWVYETCPGDLSILQLGHAPDFKVPSNIKVKHIAKEKMPRAICRCRCVIAPYTSKDSCPRIVPEALACGVPVVALPDLQIWHEKYPITIAEAKDFWDMVKKIINYDPVTELFTRSYYEEHLSLPVAASHLRNLLERALYEKRKGRVGDDSIQSPDNNA